MHSNELLFSCCYAVFLLMTAVLLAPLVWAAVLDGRYHAMRLNRSKRT